MSAVWCRRVGEPNLPDPSSCFLPKVDWLPQSSGLQNQVEQMGLPHSRHMDDWIYLESHTFYIQRVLLYLAMKRRIPVRSGQYPAAWMLIPLYHLITKQSLKPGSPRVPRAVLVLGANRCQQEEAAGRGEQSLAEALSC